MAKKKYYAVRIGKVPGVYNTWEECKAQTDGVSGALYKSFPSLEEAEKYMMQDISEGNSNEAVAIVPMLENLNNQVDNAIAALGENEVIAFVDGSYDVTGEKSAFGVIIFSHGGNKDTLYRAFTKDLGTEFISLRNVAAELEGVKEAINWALQYHKSKISIYYDYEGIENWANGKWSAKKEITKNYVHFIQEKKTCLQIEFVKVPAHSGVKLNEEVDAIAKKALLARGHKTYNDGSVYFVGYDVKDWRTIVQILNDENIGLAEQKTISPIILNKETIGTREKIKITQGSNTVIINCYRNSKSFVQGKQTVLFQKIIATAIELLENKSTVIETLNNYHALTINTDEVENLFEQMLPHYRHESEKHYNNLLSAVYNTMLTGYMPDYTCLVTPIFRAYEYYLHRILGDIMQLDTETDNGANKFTFFSKNPAGLYECNKPEKSLLSPNQLDYLNRLYTKYNSVRHPYSHWSASDVDTAVITTIDLARDLLNDGLKLVDQYYTLF